MARRWLYGVLVVLAISLVVSSGSFSAVSADRGMNVAVADDTSAFVGYETACENRKFEVTITNRFESALTDGSITVGGTTESVGELGPGEQETTAFDHVEQGDPVTVELQGPTKTVELERSVPGACPSTGNQDVTFPGNSGNNVVQIDDASGTYWTLDGGSAAFDISSGNSLQSESSPIVLVYVAETDTTYVHPGLSGEDMPYEIENGQRASDPCTIDGEVALDDLDLDEC
jgi:hypothetical protein